MDYRLVRQGITSKVEGSSAKTAAGTSGHETLNPLVRWVNERLRKPAGGSEKDRARITVQLIKRSLVSGRAGLSILVIAHSKGQPFGVGIFSRASRARASLPLTRYRQQLKEAVRSK